MNPGILYATLAFFCWGMFPLYFHAIDEVPPNEILAHRVLWSLLFLGAMLTIRKQWAWLPQVLKQPRVLASFAASALLLTINWGVYIWSVNNGHVIDASLGCFITPLVNVLMGLIVLQERLRRAQWIALGVAATGVAFLTWQTGHLPWIPLILALSFGSYGLLRKTAALAALEGLSLETMMLFPLALAYLAWLTMHGHNTFLNTHHDSVRWLLGLSGPITAIPLLLFAAGARKIPLAMLGLIQYLSPTIQALLGLLVFHEAFQQDRLLGFLIILAALLLYMAEGLQSSRRMAAAG